MKTYGLITFDIGLFASFLTSIGILPLFCVNNRWRVVVTEVLITVELFVVATVGTNQVFEVDGFVVVVRMVGKRDDVGGLRMPASPTWKYFVFKGTSFA